MIQIKRAYEPVTKGDGPRFLVDLLWPRGLKKDDLKLKGWPKDVAPSSALRKWFGHDPERWEEFQKRYFDELKAKPETWQPLLQTARKHNITLVFGARDTEHNNAVALKRFFETKLKSG